MNCLDIFSVLHDVVHRTLFAVVVGHSFFFFYFLLRLTQRASHPETKEKGKSLLPEAQFKPTESRPIV